MEHPNFLNVFLGKSRRGKTTKAILKMDNYKSVFGNRIIVYGQRFSNDEMKKRWGKCYIKDTQANLESINKFFSEEYRKQHPEIDFSNGLFILKTGENNIYDLFKEIKNCYFLLDDVTLIVDDNEPFKQFLATVGMNECICDMTTHVPRGDMPKKGMDLATDVYIVGGYDGDINLRYLYDNVRDIKPWDFKDFKKKLEDCPPYIVVKIKGAVDPKFS